LEQSDQKVVSKDKNSEVSRRVGESDKKLLVNDIEYEENKHDNGEGNEASNEQESIAYPIG